jgi:hypothetical protein
MVRVSHPIDRSAWTKARWWSFITLSVLVQMLGWSFLLEHNLARGEKLWQVVTEQKDRNFTVLSADFLEFRDYYRAFPKTINEASPQNVYVEFYKRPLYGPISAALTICLYRVFGITYPRSMFVILPLYATLATMLLFHVLKTVGIPTLEAGVLAGVGTLSFAWLSVFSVPESYSLSVCAALLAMLSGARLPGLEEQGAGRAIARHALVAGATAWIYPPTCGAVFLAVSRISHRKQLLTTVLPAVALAAVVAFAPHGLSGRSEVQQQIDYGGRWSSPHHFVDAELVAEVGSAFLFFGLVSPVDDFVYASPRVNLTTAFGTGMRLVGVCVILACYGAVALIVIAHGQASRMSGALLWFVSLFAFHLFFNPREVLLYLSVPIAVLIYLVGLAVVPLYEKHFTRSKARSVPLACLLLFVMMMILANARAITGI